MGGPIRSLGVLEMRNPRGCPESCVEDCQEGEHLRHDETEDEVEYIPVVVVFSFADGYLKTQTRRGGIDRGI